MRVLVIEDDAALNGILAKRLAEEGHSVDCCFDGRDGLDYAEAADYDCIVLDWMLPKMDGLTLLRRLRGGGNHANVLLLTGLHRGPGGRAGRRGRRLSGQALRL